MKFAHLLHSIQQTHTALQQQAVSAVNRSLTIRNWLIGYYIVEFEQKGEDRAKYGEGLLQSLSEKLSTPGLSYRNLKLFRQFYFLYKHIGRAVSAQLNQDGFISTKTVQALIEQITSIENLLSPIVQTPSALLSNLGTVSQEINLSLTQQPIGQTLSAQLQLVPPEKIINKLSFSHLVELFGIDDPLKRTFYEIECIKGTWGVRELKRQIGSLYFERSGLSQNPEKLSAMVAEKAEPLQPSDIIKSVYTFEFLGLKAKEVIEESDLETALLNHLQEFLLELGHGFCFEARQQKLLIGDEYYPVDLVFYHRILKCHVLIDLKVEKFSHNNAGQLNTYLNYYKKEMMQPGDNPPVGILMVTDKNKALVEYATAGMDNALFVSKYLVHLPGKEQLLQFVQNELKKL